MQRVSKDNIVEEQVEPVILFITKQNKKKTAAQIGDLLRKDYFIDVATPSYIIMLREEIKQTKRLEDGSLVWV